MPLVYYETEEELAKAWEEQKASRHASEMTPRDDVACSDPLISGKKDEAAARSYGSV